MLVSPPFALPLPPAAQSGSPAPTLPVEPARIPAIQACPPGKGGYPLTASLGWHGGTHLIAPRNDIST